MGDVAYASAGGSYGSKYSRNRINILKQSPPKLTAQTPIFIGRTHFCTTNLGILLI